MKSNAFAETASAAAHTRQGKCMKIAKWRSRRLPKARRFRDRHGIRTATVVETGHGRETPAKTTKNSVLPAEFSSQCQAERRIKRLLIPQIERSRWGEAVLNKLLEMLCNAISQGLAQGLNPKTYFDGTIGEAWRL
jgi:hypothetical protein